MFIFAPANRKGEVLEWLKRRVWKARDLPKGFAGSNPALSAESRGCHQPRLFASTAGSPFLFFLERGIYFISCAFAPMAVPSPPPQSSAPVPTLPSACYNLHRRIPDIFSVLLRTGKPPPSVFRLAQEECRRPCTPPVQMETLTARVPTRTGGARTTLQPSYAPYSSCARATSGIPPFPSRIPDK